MMRYTYNRKAFPPLRAETLARIHFAADRLHAKLKNLKLDDLSLSAYGRDMASDFQAMAEEGLKKYVHLIAWSLYPELEGMHEMLIDYGGGHGLLACLAKELGIRRVVYNDIFSGCCADAQVLAQAMDCKADDYICGDMSDVQGRLQNSPPSSLALVSINVIEHIYALEKFLQTAATLTKGPMTMALSTSANSMNPLVARNHRRQHRLWEFQDGPHEGSYPMDSTRAFCSVRRDIIATEAPGLDKAQVASVVAATRGMWKPDIEMAVRDYQKTGRLPDAPSHPTNTCDPITGSWQERLLDVTEVSRFLASLGFSTRVRGGYYSGRARSRVSAAIKRVLASILNHAISAFGNDGARLAPCLMFHASRH